MSLPFRNETKNPNSIKREVSPFLNFFSAGNTVVINDTKNNVVLAENIDFNINASDTGEDVSSAEHEFLKTVSTESPPHEVALGNER